MNAIAIVSGIGFGLAVGFLLGHAFAVWSRRRFIHSLMPATGEHTDFEEMDVRIVDTRSDRESFWGDVQRANYHSADMRRDRVRRHAETQVTFPENGQ